MAVLRWKCWWYERDSYFTFCATEVAERLRTLRVKPSVWGIAPTMKGTFELEFEKTLAYWTQFWSEPRSLGWLYFQGKKKGFAKKSRPSSEPSTNSNLSVFPVPLPSNPWLTKPSKRPIWDESFKGKHTYPSVPITKTSSIHEISREVELFHITYTC